MPTQAMLTVLQSYGKAHPTMGLQAANHLASIVLGGRLPDNASQEYLKQLATTYLGPGLKAQRKSKLPAAAEEEILMAKVPSCPSLHLHGGCNGCQLAP